MVEIEMSEVFDELVSGVEMLADGFMSTVGALYEEAEATVEFLIKGIGWIERALDRATVRGS